MKKFLRVFWNEYSRHVFRRRFIVIILSLPVFCLLAILMAGISTVALFNPRPVGYVDQGGWLVSPASFSSPEDSSFFDVDLIPYPDEEEALRDLKNGRIQGFYILPPDYLETGRARLVAEKPMSPSAEAKFSTFLKANLLAGQPAEIARRVIDGMELNTRLPANEQQAETPAWIQVLLPALIGAVFILLINTSGGYLVQTVTDEKENRTIEILITSLSPQQLMTGKVVGSLSVGLTQMIVWILFPLVSFFLLRGSFTGLAQIHLDPQFFWVSALTLLACFIMISGLMASVGATAGESREAQQISSIFTLPILVPYMFLAALVTDPNSLLARGLSYFPLTAPVALPIRAAFIRLPAWEIVLNLSILFATAGIALWLAGRAFRLGLLRYGKPVTLKELFGKP